MKRTFSHTEIFNRISAEKLIKYFLGCEDQSRNPICSSRIIYFQGGSACQYTLNVTKCSFRFTKAHKTTKQNEESVIVFCDHVNKCYK